MLNISLLKDILLVSIASSIISTSLIQRLKYNMKSKNHIGIKCFIISMLIGIIFSLTFSSLSILYSLWVGLISFIGADAIYKAFEDKIFKKYSDIEETIKIERGEENVS